MLFISPLFHFQLSCFFAKCVCDVIRVFDQKIIQQHMTEKGMNLELKF